MLLLDLPQLPATPTELLLRLSAPCARLGHDPRRISAPRAQLALAAAEHEQYTDARREALASLAASPRKPDGDEAARESFAEWQENCWRTQLELIEALCCWSLPLDHPYGELLQLKEVGGGQVVAVEGRELDHWEYAAADLARERDEALAAWHGGTA